MADQTGEAKSDAAIASASASQRLKLQSNLGRALLFSRGFGAEEAKAALVRAQELALQSANRVLPFHFRAAILLPVWRTSMMGK